MKRGAALLTAVAMLPAVANAAPATGEAQIAIVTPLSFIQVENLDFGRVISGPTAATVTVSTTNARTSTGGIVLVGNDYQMARFSGRGAQNQRVRIRITPNIVTLTGPGPSMTIGNFTIGTDGTLQQTGGSPNYRIVAANGIFWFNVGGQLNVGANQPPGRYSGTFNATLDYQ